MVVTPENFHFLLEKVGFHRNWIADATVLRWAELTVEISQGALKPSQIIDQLLTPPIEERNVQAARIVHETLADKVCVWTDRALRADFDVDHAIPCRWTAKRRWTPAGRRGAGDKVDLLAGLEKKILISNFPRLPTEIS